ncbi:MAG: zinc ribbon domain-containing protein [Erysipelotrichaceae bacterium]|nr:zinc ribbon domain-containing protein [Erysipelotrichaceae bacterium]
MSVKLEKIVKTYYDGLEEGKILGRKCKRCGAIEFPPVYACNTCGCPDTEWVEISGKAKMTSLIMPAVLSTKPQNNDLMPYCFATVEIEEGAGVNAMVQGVSKKNRDELMAKLPVDVHAKIIQRGEVKTVIFELDEGE